MGIKCPKCNFDNPDTQRFCGECGTQIIPAEEISVSRTKTFQIPKKELIRRTAFAGKYDIIRYLYLSFKTERPSPCKNHKFFIVQRNL